MYCGRSRHSVPRVAPGADELRGRIVTIAHEYKWMNDCAAGQNLPLQFRRQSRGLIPIAKSRLDARQLTKRIRMAWIYQQEPLKGCGSFAIPLQRSKELAAVVESARVIRPYRKRSLIVGHCLLAATQSLQRQAAVVERLNVIRPQRERSVVGCNGFRESIAACKHQCSAVMRFRRARIERKRLV